MRSTKAAAGRAASTVRGSLVHDLGDGAVRQLRRNGHLAQEHVAIDQAHRLVVDGHGDGGHIRLGVEHRPDLGAGGRRVDRGSAVDKAGERVHAAIRRGVVGTSPSPVGVAES
jgi:hypothetical protein